MKTTPAQSTQWMRGLFVCAVVLAAASTVFAEDAPPCPRVGAIRWDAWYGGEITRAVEKTLAPAQFQFRLPWFADVRGDGDARIDGNRQGVMDREIACAADAGLGYWAFLLYPRQNSMSTALSVYLKSAQRNRVGFCLILHNALGVDEAHWPGERQRILDLLREPGYVKVLDGRPLVYFFESNLQRFADLRKTAEAAALHPYYVYMGWNPPADFQKMTAHGFDAVSAYACGSDDATFAELCQRVESNFWKRAADASVPYIPLVTTGWDKRPRQVNPVPWEKGSAYLTQKTFPSTATPGEIAAHLTRALAFTRDHPKICAANAVIIYAWNEHDEGGWLCPTWQAGGTPDEGRLKAVKAAIDAHIKEKAQP